ncbi:hypothetical protein SCHPADRAFT_908965 [Schizopora paradoxa]|uniref:Uncharacterized protein n=1 Tax=Schizopora paradoxa TaxID=27342 RepID=A0A0H2R9F5_9AGAM|nr:hypothetical protein SCHPADRAFT_908965 [Schizopora paradoxa]
MPNVQSVSMILPQQADLFLYDRDVLRHLRTMQLKLPQSNPNDFKGQMQSIKRFFVDGHCKDLEVFEVQFRRSYQAGSSKADLHEIFGEKLRWIEF